MIVDRAHGRWIAVCLLVLLVATAVYVPYHLRALNGPSGGSWLGLFYGFAGYGLMLFAGALGLRARRPTWRLGRAETWLKGHVWLALLAVPLILFHAGFRLGGPLTVVLMALFGVVTASGILGVALQQFLPRAMMDRVPLETIYEELDHVLAQLRGEADALVMAACDPDRAALVSAAPAPGRRPAPSARRAQLAVTVPRTPPPEARSLQEFYERDVRPYLYDESGRAALLNSPAKAGVVFAQLRTRLPASLHPVVDDLEAICEERRQLRVQAHLHSWLHGWLLAHVPISLALLLLSAVHAVVALRY